MNCPGSKPKRAPDGDWKQKVTTLGASGRKETHSSSSLSDQKASRGLAIAFIAVLIALALINAVAVAIDRCVGRLRVDPVECGAAGVLRVAERRLRAAGLCAELRSHFKTGTVLVVRTTGASGSNSGEDGIRTLTLAEVKWSKPMSTEGMVYYATGLKYLML